MEHIIKQLKNGAKHTRLSVAEKATIKSALLRHVKMNPVRNENFARHYSSKANAILSPFQINNLRNKKTMPLLIMLGLLMGGSASFAAENTVPGDVLYPVKVHVNEAVRGAVAVTPKAKAEWEVRLVERRLEEVEKLATTPNALPEAQQVAQANLTEYTDRVKEHIAKFDEENDSEDALATAGDLADALRTHEGVLAGLSTQVAGASASSTTAVTASSTATTTVDVATSTTSTVSVADAQSLATILAQLRADRGDVEKKHKDLEHKYHPEAEVQNAEEDNVDNGSDEVTETPHARFTPVPASSISTMNSTSSTTTGTSTVTNQAVTPAVPRTDYEGTSGRNEHEEIRATSGSTSAPSSATTVSTPAPTAPATHTESHTETHTEAPRTSDHD